MENKQNTNIEKVALKKLFLGYREFSFKDKKTNEDKIGRTLYFLDIGKYKEPVVIKARVLGDITPNLTNINFGDMVLVKVDLATILNEPDVYDVVKLESTTISNFYRV